MAYKAPKTIIDHPGVAECTDGTVDSDYRHDVWLRAGWAWARGVNEGGRGLFVNTVAEFLHAEPTKTA